MCYPRVQVDFLFLVAYSMKRTSKRSEYRIFCENDSRKDEFVVLRVVGEFCKKNKAFVIILIYMVFYMVAFQALENRRVPYHLIQFGIDGYIPFCEYFVIPYFLWFLYVAVAVLYFGIREQSEGNKMIAFLILGMTVFIIVSAIYPNGLNIRPKVFERDNFCVDLVKFLYSIDTSTNVLPSIHVYNSIAVMIAVVRSKSLKKYKLLKVLMFLLGLSIICSTVLIKQHSMLDVSIACMLSVLCYSICYHGEFENKKEIAKVKS